MIRIGTVNISKRQEEYLVIADRHITEAEERIRLQRQQLKRGQGKGETPETKQDLLSKGLLWRLANDK